jgi:hypothetical protein
MEITRCVVMKGSDLQLQNPDSPFGDGKSHFFVAESVEEIQLPSLMIRGYSGNLNHTNLGIFIMAGISGIELKNSTENKGSPQAMRNEPVLPSTSLSTCREQISYSSHLIPIVNTPQKHLMKPWEIPQVEATVWHDTTYALGPGC